MQRLHMVLALNVALSLVAIVSADEKESAVDRVFADVDRTDSPEAAVAIVRGAELVYQRGYGMANLEHGIPSSHAIRTKLGEGDFPIAG